MTLCYFIKKYIIKASKEILGLFYFLIMSRPQRLILLFNS